MAQEKAHIPKEQILPVLALTISGFIFNCSEFMPIGLLSDISASFSISQSTCGIMISAYAWAVMILSVPLMIAASRVSPRRLVIAVVMLFGAGQLFTALAPTFELLVVARLIVASAHAIFWSVASPFAVRVVGEENGSAAIGMVAAGTCIASVLGMPLGRTIGLLLGWRLTFGAMTLLTALGVVMLGLVFPRIETGESFSPSQLGGLAKNRTLAAIYVMVALLITGYFAGYSYIEPYLAQVSHLESGTITIALMVFGLSGLVGSRLFTRFYKKCRKPFLALSIAGIPLALIGLAPLGGHVAGVFFVCIIWGVTATTFTVACQDELIAVTTNDESAVAMSIYSAIYNLGIGFGSFIGGRVVDGLGLGYIGIVGGAIALCAFIWCILRLLPQLRPTEQEN